MCVGSPLVLTPSKPSHVAHAACVRHAGEKTETGAGLCAAYSASSTATVRLAMSAACASSAASSASAVVMVPDVHRCSDSRY